MKLDDKGEAHEGHKNMVEWSQCIAEGVGFNAKTIVYEKADASNKKDDSCGEMPGNAALNHKA